MISMVKKLFRYKVYVDTLSSSGDGTLFIGECNYAPVVMSPTNTEVNTNPKYNRFVSLLTFINGIIR